VAVDVLLYAKTGVEVRPSARMLITAMDNTESTVFDLFIETMTP
jgi:hypothetical protein